MNLPCLNSIDFIFYLEIIVEFLLINILLLMMIKHKNQGEYMNFLVKTLLIGICMVGGMQALYRPQTGASLVGTGDMLHKLFQPWYAIDQRNPKVHPDALTYPWGVATQKRIGSQQAPLVETALIQPVTGVYNQINSGSTMMGKTITQIEGIEKVVEAITQTVNDSTMPQQFKDKLINTLNTFEAALQTLSNKQKTGLIDDLQETLQNMGSNKDTAIAQIRQSQANFNALNKQNIWPSESCSSNVAVDHFDFLHRLWCAGMHLGAQDALTDNTKYQPYYGYYPTWNRGQEFILK